jgi:hypothetical protein
VGRALLVCVVVLLVSPSIASADRPTSGDLSIFSGRTQGIGETAIAGGVGWPGVWAMLALAPSSTFNLGLKGSVVYGSPAMGLGAGVGGAVAVPLRFHFFGEGMVDLAITVEPSFFLGEGSIAGQRGSFANDFGLGGLVTGGLLAGFQFSESFTLAAGVLGEIGLVSTPDADDTDVIGAVLGMIALEILMSRDTMIFVDVRSGYGFRPDELFEGPAIVRASVGLAYLF